MITSGGADYYSICYHIAERLAPKHSDIIFHVVSGPFNEHRRDLLTLELEHSNIVVEQSVRDMQQLESLCDIAIASAGSTMYELSAIGIPTITFYFVDNQKMIAEAYANMTGIVNAGDYAVDSNAVIRKIEETFELLATNHEMREENSRNMQQVTDGNGAMRIADAILG